MATKPNFCPNCGKDTSKSATFCSHCGVRLIPESGQSSKNSLDLRSKANKPQVENEHIDRTTSAQFIFWKSYLIWLGSTTTILFIIFIAAGSANDGSIGDLLLGTFIICLLLAFLGTMFRKWRFLKKYPEARGEYPVVEDEKLKGVRGWLALFCLGLLASAVLAGSALYTDITAYNTADNLGLSEIVWFEILANVAFIILAILTFVLIVRHKKLAIIIASVYLVVSLVGNVADTALINYYLPQAQNSDTSQGADTTNEGRAFLAALIWVPYFQKSRRVKATLTK